MKGGLGCRRNALNCDAVADVLSGDRQAGAENNTATMGSGGDRPESDPCLAGVAWVISLLQSHRSLLLWPVGWIH